MKRRKKLRNKCRRDQALSFRTRHHLCRQGMVLAVTQQLRSKGPVSVHALRTEGVTGSEGRQASNGVGGGVGVEGRNGDGNWGEGGNGDVNSGGDGDGAGEGTGTGTGWRGMKERKIGTGTGAGTEREQGRG